MQFINIKIPHSQPSAGAGSATAAVTATPHSNTQLFTLGIIQKQRSSALLSVYRILHSVSQKSRLHVMNEDNEELTKAGSQSQLRRRRLVMMVLFAGLFSGRAQDLGPPVWIKMKILIFV